MNDWSSFPKDKQLMDSWRKHLNEGPLDAMDDFTDWWRDKEEYDFGYKGAQQGVPQDDVRLPAPAADVEWVPNAEVEWEEDEPDLETLPYLLHHSFGSTQTKSDVYKTYKNRYNRAFKEGNIETKNQFEKDLTYFVNFVGPFLRYYDKRKSVSEEKDIKDIKKMISVSHRFAQDNENISNIINTYRATKIEHPNSAQSVARMAKLFADTAAKRHLGNLITYIKKRNSNEKTRSKETH
tara:strand:+ start:6816 stop:7526 length:711 start_codon:yes stop_codon:yes gene_type:complete